MGGSFLLGVGVWGDSGRQSPSLHGRLHHPGHGGHAFPAGLPRLLRSHTRKQVFAAF
ncbi:hypothetical protein M9458_036433, partial [Cirrhinus mrigala]